MLVDGVRTKFKAMVNLSMPIKMNMRANFMLIGQTDLESMYKSVVKRMKVIGPTTSPMDKVN